MTFHQDPSSIFNDITPSTNKLQNHWQSEQLGRKLTSYAADVPESLAIGIYLQVVDIQENET